MPDFVLTIEGQQPLQGTLTLEEPVQRNVKRILNDFERQDMNFQSRTLDPEWREQYPNMNQAPQVGPFFLTPNTTSGGNRTPMANWKPYLQAINGVTNDNDQKWRYYINDHSGYYNRAGWDKLESLWMGDNLVNEIETQRGFSRIETLFLEDGPPDPALVNYEQMPWLVHRFTVVTSNNTIVEPPPGRIYSPIVVKRGLVLWIQSDLLVSV